MENKSFSSFEFKSGLLSDLSDNKFPTKLYAFNDGDTFEAKLGSTYFVFQFEGFTGLFLNNCKNYYDLGDNHYACLIEGMLKFHGKAIVIERVNSYGIFSLGGPIEENGRLKYIDGCTDSLLVPPVRFGDACLNALFFPPNINQTQHTHPSMRVGLIVSGRGECITPEGNIDLIPGQIFIIHEDGLHSFRTFEDSAMVVIAYHPDSNFGPKDEEHPMINRTMVNGVSASELGEIQTK